MSPCRQAPLAAALFAILCIDLALIAGCVSVPDSSAAVAPTCPFGSDPSADDFNPVTIANRALGSLFYDGQIAEAYACHAVAAAGIHPSQSDESWALAIEQNKRLLELLLGPRRPGSPRVYHNATGLTGLFPPSASQISPVAVDRSIGVWDGALSATECAELIELFESSPSLYFDGNLLSYGKSIVDYTYKKVTELDITDKATTNATWLLWDRRLLSVTYRHLKVRCPHFRMICQYVEFRTTGARLQLYEEANPLIRTYTNPMDEEGFKMKRYTAQEGHHEYHMDGGHETRGEPRRILAMLVYLNDVAEGGETAFLMQGQLVAPRCGRVTIFPTAFTHVHAGRPPLSGPKYAISQFIRI